MAVNSPVNSKQNSKVTFEDGVLTKARGKAPLKQGKKKLLNQNSEGKEFCLNNDNSVAHTIMKDASQYTHIELQKPDDLRQVTLAKPHQGLLNIQSGVLKKH